MDRFIGGKGGFDWRGPKAKLLGKVYSYLADYLILPEHYLLVISAWVLASYLVDLWDRFPHLAIVSPIGRCGKSRVLELLEKVCLHPWPVMTPSPAVVYRRIAAGQRPTLLYDEAQALDRGDKSENNAVMYELLCGGITKNASVPRCVGPNHEPTDFPIYCPKVIVRIGKLKGILGDRCLRVTIKRKLKHEKTKRCRERVWGPQGEAIREELVAWSADAARQEQIKEVYNELDLFDIDNERMAELLLPLQAVLTVEFGEDGYPLCILKRYADGLEETDREAEKQDPGVQLLAACREIFAPFVKKYGDGHLPTETLIQKLVERTEEPWAEYNHGKPINAERLAGLLKEYGIKSAKEKYPDGTVHRGYFSADFKDAWARYLTPLRTPS